MLDNQGLGIIFVDNENEHAYGEWFQGLNPSCFKAYIISKPIGTLAFFLHCYLNILLKNYQNTSFRSNVS